MISQFVKKNFGLPFIILIVVSLLVVTGVGVAVTAAGNLKVSPKPEFSVAVAFDVSPAVRDLVPDVLMQFMDVDLSEELFEIRPEPGPIVVDQGFTGDWAIQEATNIQGGPATATGAIIRPLFSFEGLSNQDNFNLYGFRVNPPDPMGDVGPHHYVQMVNLAFAVYDKQGNRLMGPIPIGSLWDGFAVNDCTDPSGDPIVLYDQLTDRWLLSQFTTRGPTYYNCVAISQTGDPTGPYYRYAFSSGEFFPDYPKYGVWTNSYLLTSRDFGPAADEVGISVYALEKSRMIQGKPNARVVKFFLDPAVVPPNLMGDGLLPADIDGKPWRLLIENPPAPIIGTQDDGGPYGASFDALNIWELSVKWWLKPTASLKLVSQLPVAEFDSIFPCSPSSRDCLPQPGITNPEQFLDILSYRQRPMWRLAYRDFGKYQAMVTTQSVEARLGIAGVRWYEIRRTKGVYSVYQQGTYAPNDGVHRWMGSIAMDWMGNIALGYSVVNGVDVYPGIRYTGRLKGDPLGEMTLDEQVIVNGSGVQTTTNSRWGDYTSMNVDPTNDRTFWYVNEYYTLEGQQSSAAGWQTRISSFNLPLWHW